MSNVPKLRFSEFSGEWEEYELNKLTKVYDGTHSTPNYVESGIPFYSVEHLTANQFAKTKYITNEVFLKENKRVKLEKDDILMTRIGDIGTSRLIDWNVKASFYVSLSLIKKSDKFDSGFINQQIKSDYFQKQLHAKTLHIAFPKKINLGEINQCKLCLPSKPEQEKIASFLTAVDKKIELLTKKESLLQEYKKGVMQKIFNQEIRFKDEDGSEFCEWEKEKLGKYLVEYKAKSILENEYPVFTSSNKGLMLQSDYFGENRLTERDNIGFNIVPNNHITYRSRSDNRTFTFNMNTLGYTGAISTYYPVFECKNGDNRFIVTLLNENKHFIGRYSVGTSQTVLSFNELKNIKMFIPTSKEQTKISDFLSSIDKKIENAKDEVEKTKEFKKALLQQMFV